MATYKVIQDIEAEDKLVGPLTLRQFIYAGIGALSGYLGFLTASKGAPFMLAVFAPITFVFGFFAFPWRQDQPTEVWALAKLRFHLKPRRRIWDQTGARELVTITVPKVVERHLTDGLGQDEVHSRLNALASTLDSRGWAVKNVNVNLDVSPAARAAAVYPSDRLVQASSLPQSIATVDVRAADDMLDVRANPVAQHFETMITASGTAHRQQLMTQLAAPVAAPSRPASPPAPRAQEPSSLWSTSGPAPTVNQPQQTPPQTMFGSDPIVAPGSIPQTWAAKPTQDETDLAAKLKAENSSSSASAGGGHLKTLKTPDQMAEEARKAVAEATAKPVAKPSVTPSSQAAIINLANNDDLDVATLARQANKQVGRDGEVVISLH